MKVFYFVYFFLTWFNLIAFGFGKINNNEEQQKDRIIFQESTENDCVIFCKSSLKCIKYQWENDTCFLTLSSDSHVTTSTTAPDLSTVASISSTQNDTKTFLSRIKRKGGRGGGGRGSSGSRGSSSSWSSSSHHYSGSSGGGGSGFQELYLLLWFICVMIIMIVLICCCIVHANEYDQSQNSFRPPRQYPPPPRGTERTTFYNNYPSTRCHYQPYYNPSRLPPPYPSAPLLLDDEKIEKNV